MSYKVIPIPSEISERVRENLKSPQYGHPATVDIAKGYGPCRSCLKTFDQGQEERILFTYNSFEGLSNLPLPGPIFIHKDSCKAYSENSFPIDLREIPMLLEGFGENSELIKREPVKIIEIDEQIEELLNLPNVLYLNLRNSEAGCFIARIEA
ncbi:MAG TPA: DUF1203 domain-containing protein [Pyrinomonadaceae bacterium]|nr:DUF1203 domain-containing protein [Pyrinomonadaceae bacterium]